MKLLYIAGSYRGKTPAHTQYNINQAWEVGRQVIVRLGRFGWFPVIPHLCSMHYDGLQSDEFFLSGTEELMLRCDAVLVQGNYMESAGTLHEIRAAEYMGIPVYYSIEDIIYENQNDQA